MYLEKNLIKFETDESILHFDYLYLYLQLRKFLLNLYVVCRFNYDTIT